MLTPHLEARADGPRSVAVCSRVRLAVQLEVGGLLSSDPPKQRLEGMSSVPLGRSEAREAQGSGHVSTSPRRAPAGSRGLVVGGTGSRGPPHCVRG